MAYWQSGLAPLGWLASQSITLSFSAGVAIRIPRLMIIRSTVDLHAFLSVTPSRLHMRWVSWHWVQYLMTILLGEEALAVAIACELSMIPATTSATATNNILIIVSSC